MLYMQHRRERKRGHFQHQSVPDECVAPSCCVLFFSTHVRLSVSHDGGANNKTFVGKKNVGRPMMREKQCSYK